MRRALAALFCLLSTAGCLRGTNAKMTVEVDAVTLTAAGPINSLSVVVEDEFQIIGRTVITAPDGGPIFDPADLGAEASLRTDFVVGFNVTPAEIVRVRVAGFDGNAAEGAPFIAGRGLLFLVPRDDGNNNRLTLSLDFACGNRAIDDGEECDDGNSDLGDGCDVVCEIGNDCGNGVLDDGEECDDGPANSNAPDANCRLNCSLATCGDNIVDPGAGEQCDPPGDSCDANCQIIIGADCGNNALDAGEICDDGNNVGGDGCRADCLGEELCGDGLVDLDANEECDDNNTANNDGCSAICLTEVCGDGVIQANEDCDDGDAQNGDGCSAACAVENGFSCNGAPSVCVADAVCGNGAVEAGETCDDGNTAAGDGCSNLCAVENGFSCNGAPSVCNGICGDGLIRGGEGCDDGNTVAGDGCDAACAVEAGFTCAGEPSVCS